MRHTKHSIHENSFFAHRVSIFVLTIYMENAIYISFFVFRIRQECEKRYGKPCFDFRTAYGKRKSVVFRFSDFVRREKNELTVHTRTYQPASKRCFRDRNMSTWIEDVCICNASSSINMVVFLLFELFTVYCHF